MLLTQAARIPSAISTSREKLLDSSYELRTRYPKAVGKLQKCGKRRTVFTSLEKTNVLWMVPTFEGERLLREVAFVAQLSESACECTLFPRIAFGSNCHGQLGVCFESENSSTKYTIRMQFSSLICSLPPQQSRPLQQSGSGNKPPTRLKQSCVGETRGHPFQEVKRANAPRMGYLRSNDSHSTDFRQPFFCCFRPTTGGNVWAVSPSVFLRLRVVALFEISYRDAAEWRVSVTGFVWSPEQNPPLRHSFTARFRHPLAVSCFLEQTVCSSNTHSWHCRTRLFAVSEHPPQVTSRTRFEDLLDRHCGQVWVRG